MAESFKTSGPRMGRLRIRSKASAIHGPGEPLGDFERVTTLTGEAGDYRVDIDGNWCVWSPAGGYLMALVLRAAGLESAFTAPLTLTCHFLAAPKLGDADVARIFRTESGRSVATLIRVFGDIDIAEDAVQDAVATALRTWPGKGLPPNPGAWITTTARNRAIDRLRRESRGRELLGDVRMLPSDDDAYQEVVEPVQDDRLRLIFTCCHPALSTEAQVALTLRLLGGLTITGIAERVEHLVTGGNESFRYDGIMNDAL